MELWTDANIDSEMCNSPLQSCFWGVNECLLFVCLFSRPLTHTDCWLCLCFMYDDWMLLLLQLNQVKSASSCVPSQCIFTPSWRTTRLTLVKERRWSSSVPPGRLSASCRLSTDDVFLISICVPLQTQTQPLRRTQSALLQSLSRYIKGRMSKSVSFYEPHSRLKQWNHVFCSLQKVVSECQDRRSCHIPVFSPVFGQDPCPLTTKYLLVAYKCRPGKLLRPLCLILTFTVMLKYFDTKYLLT